MVTLLLHGLFKDKTEIQSGAAYPQQETTLECFAAVIEYFLEAGYTLTTPERLLNHPAAKGRFALITFDDGYFNNTRALPILEKYNVPATVFVSAGHVVLNKPFWWEALYHARLQRNTPLQEIYREASLLNFRRSEEIERALSEELGPDFLRTRNEVDRPMTAEELRKFSAHPLICIGNHTFDHNVLTAYPPAQVRESIRKAQHALTEITGRTPRSIAYPNGEFNQEIVRIAREEGLEIGFSAIPRKEYLPGALSSDRRMVLGRFCPHPDHDLRAQYDYFRSDVMLTNRLRALRRSSRVGY